MPKGIYTRKAYEPEREGFKRCSKCRELLPLDDFHKDPNTSDGHNWHCKDCNRTGVLYSAHRKLLRVRGESAARELLASPAGAGEDTRRGYTEGPMTKPKRDYVLQALERVITHDGWATWITEDPMASRALLKGWERTHRLRYIRPLSFREVDYIIQHKRATRDILLAMIERDAKDDSLIRRGPASWLLPAFREYAEALEKVLFDLDMLLHESGRTPTDMWGEDSEFWTLTDAGVAAMEKLSGAA